MTQLKSYRITFKDLCNSSSDNTIRTLLSHFERINPKEKGKGTFYKYRCPECKQLYIHLNNYVAELIVDIACMEKLCAKCTALLMQLNVCDFR